MSPRLSIVPLLLVASLSAQEALDPNALNALKAGAAQAGAQGQPQGQIQDALPRASRAAMPADPEQGRLEESEAERLDKAIRALKAKERGPLRFAADLFEVRQRGTGATEGGIAEDYVLGTGDRLALSAFGSAAFELPLQVDGRGEVVIPKVGAVKVGGLTLGKARSAVQGLVSRNFSATSVDLSVTKLREVRVFVLGEVYKSGSYLVSSLSSLVNVLSLAGGPTPAGSFRQIRVMRGGRVIHTLDLYPLRAEGLGNMNFSLQNGDTLFVPLAANQVVLEGAFQRVVAAAAALPPKDGISEQDSEQETLRKRIRQEEARLEYSRSGLRNSKALPTNLANPAAPDALRQQQELDAEAQLESLSPTERTEVEQRVRMLKAKLKALVERERGDQRLSEEEARKGHQEEKAQPAWLERWQAEGKAPRMQFEMQPGETAAQALRFAGGFALQAFSEGLNLRRLDAKGAVNAQDLALAALDRTVLQRGDVLSALPRRDRLERVVEVRGWARVPGTFARNEGLKVGDLLARDGQMLPDTYPGRGEITRTLADGTTRFLAFDVVLALKGDPTHNLALENRDRIELYRVDDLRLPRNLTVVGPVTRPGTFAWHEGMRAADLLFRAGVPLREADRFIAELAHTRDGKPSDVKRLDLAKLLSTEQGSPVGLKDDAVNPLLEPFDQLSIYARPDYRLHRTIKLSGQVTRPGSYVFDTDHPRLKDLLARAGGLTPEAMPQAGIFLRSFASQDPEKQRAALESGLDAQDPTAQGVNSVLERLAETKRQPTTGQLMKNPLLHKLETGSLNRLVVDMPALLAGDGRADVELQDGDEIIIPRRTDAAYVVGETASPFAVYEVKNGMTVSRILALAGGTTRNADTWNIRLLKADGRILDSWVSWRKVEPGDTVLVPQRIRRDTTWQENLTALTPLAILINTLRN